MGEWRSVKLDELGTVERGRSRHRPRNDPSLYGGPYPFFQTGDVKAAELWLTKHSQTYNEAGLAQSKLWDSGTLCITIAANIAESSILRVQGAFPDSIVGFVPNPATADVRFVKYLLDMTKLRMQAISQGTTQDNLSVDKLLSFEFHVPPVRVQRKIAAVMAAYDELIENNLRRIEILEEMAQAVYQEWFVNLRYPGNENVPLVDSPLGPIPEGWRVTSLSDVGKVMVGGDWGKDQQAGPEWVEAACLRGVDIRSLRVTGSTEPRRRWVKRSSLEKRRIEPVDVVVEASASIGSSLAGHSAFEYRFRSPVIYSNFCKRIRFATPSMARYIERVLNSMVEDGTMDAFRTGSTIPNLNFAALVEERQLLLPPEGLVDRFGDFVSPIYDFAYMGLSANLRSTRDLLLPKLVSGEIDVSDLDIDTAWLVT